jgi:hypothetical protein
MKFWTWVFIENLSKNFKIHKNLTRILGTLRENQRTFFIISPSIPLWMRNVSVKICTQNQSKLCMFNNILFSKIVLFMKLCGKIVYIEEGRDNIWRMGIHAGYLLLQIHIIWICNTYCISTATIFARTSLNVTLCVHCLPCFTNSRTLKQKAPDNNEVHLSVLIRGSLGWKTFRVATLAHKIGGTA